MHKHATLNHGGQFRSTEFRSTESTFPGEMILGTALALRVHQVLQTRTGENHGCLESNAPEKRGCHVQTEPID